MHVKAEMAAIIVAAALQCQVIMLVGVGGDCRGRHRSRQAGACSLATELVETLYVIDGGREIGVVIGCGVGGGGRRWFWRRWALIVV